MYSIFHSVLLYLFVSIAKREKEGKMIKEQLQIAPTWYLAKDDEKP